MPIVPFTKGARETLGRSNADLTPPPLDWTLMAAAQMHSEGRLIEARGATKLPASVNIEDRRGSNKPEGDHVDDAADEAAFRTRRKYLKPIEASLAPEAD